MKTFRVIFQNGTGLRIYSCQVKTNGDRNRAIGIACRRQPRWLERCEQVTAVELPPRLNDQAPRH